MSNDEQPTPTISGALHAFFKHKTNRRACQAVLYTVGFLWSAISQGTTFILLLFFALMILFVATQVYEPHIEPEPKPSTKQTKFRTRGF